MQVVYNIFPISDKYQNILLGKLSEESIRSMEPDLHRVSLVKSQVLYEDDTPIDAVYFLEAGLATLVADTGDGAHVQVGMVGREGFTGTVSMFDGDLRSLHRAVVQIAGFALRMSQARFQQATEELPDLKHLCLRHLKATQLQVSQLAACSARHSIPQRLCRLVLMVQDRTGGTQVTLTQEDLALMLGVRRSGISVIISNLESSDILRQSRGRLEIVDRMKLKSCCCKCYTMIADRQSQIMAMTP